MASSSLPIGHARIRLRTERVCAEVSGPIAGCMIDLLCFVHDHAEREQILKKMTKLHADMTKTEQSKAETPRNNRDKKYMLEEDL